MNKFAKTALKYGSYVWLIFGLLITIGEVGYILDGGAGGLEHENLTASVFAIRGAIIYALPAWIVIKLANKIKIEPTDA